MSTNETKAAAILLFQRAQSADNLVGAWMNQHGRGYLEGLRGAVEQAAAKLRGAEEAMALSIAIDALMPGWVYVDASDHLPEEKWCTFISDNPDEWIAWLIGNGVPGDDARKLTEDAFGRQVTQ